MTSRKQNAGYFADCYVLTDNRTKAFIHSFLDKFVPNRQETAEEYEIPQYSDKPTIIYQTTDELIDHLIKNKNDIHTIYWSNKDKSNVRGAMCFFTCDLQLIIGLYCETTYPDTRIENKHLKEMLDFSKSTNGYIAYEEPAPHDTEEFLEKVKLSNVRMT